MKFLLSLLAAVAVASATFIAGKSINVLDDGTIIIRCENGKRMMISKSMGPYGQELLEIEVTGPNVIGKKIQIDDHNLIRVASDIEHNLMKENYRTFPRMEDDDSMERTKRSKMTEKSQSDILNEIMNEYQGVVDEASYKKLLSKVQKAVQKGKISADVLEHLQELSQEEPWATSMESDATMGTHSMMNSMGMGKWGQFTGTSGRQQMLMGAQWPMFKWWTQQGKTWPTNMMNKCTQAMCEQMPSWCYMNCQGMQMMRMKGWTPMAMSSMGMTPMGMRPMGVTPMSMTPVDMPTNGMSMVQSLPWYQHSMRMSPIMSQRMPISENLMDSQIMNGKDMMGKTSWYMPWNTYPLEGRMMLTQ